MLGNGMQQICRVAYTIIVCKPVHLSQRRKCYSLNSIRSGVSAKFVKAVMGRTNIKTTEGCMSTDQDTIRDQMGKVTLEVLASKEKEESASKKDNDQAGEIVANEDEN
jgi:hypothetical protein